MNEVGDWVSITEAAGRLSAGGDVVDRSTLSRYLKQHAGAIEVRPEGKQSLVDFDALKAHRGENIRLRTLTSNGRPAPQSPRRIAGSQSDGMARKANADADLREMELAKRRGHLTIVGEVAQAAADSIALMQSAFDRAVEAAAASCAVRFGYDERKMRIEFKAFARDGVEAFNRAILKRLDQAERARMAAGDEPFDEMASASAPLQ